MDFDYKLKIPDEHKYRMNDFCLAAHIDKFKSEEEKKQVLKEKFEPIFELQNKTLYEIIGQEGFWERGLDVYDNIKNEPNKTGTP